MKVTVSFGDTKVVVPCGDGVMPVRDLIDKAMHRYRKSASAAMAAGVPGPASGLLAGWAASPDGNSDGPPAVDYVKLARDNGILDWDDRVCDVLDDRELVVACLAQPDPPNNNVPNALSGPCARVPPLHDGGGGTDDSLGSASSPEFHTAPASAALSAITARVRHTGGGESGSGGAPGSLTTLGDTCSPGGSTSGASSAAAPDHHQHHPASSSSKQHGLQQPQQPPPPLQPSQLVQVPFIGQLKATSTVACNATSSTAAPAGLPPPSHSLGCPAAAGGSEPALGPSVGLARIVCCRRAYAGSSIHVSGSGIPSSGSPPTSRGPNGSLFAHRHHLHRGSLDSFAVASSSSAAPGAPAGARGPSDELANDNLPGDGPPPFLESHPACNSSNNNQAASHQPSHQLQHQLSSHSHLGPASIAVAAAAAGKARAERASESSPSPGIPGRSPVMVAVDSNSSSDHDEDYPRLRREPLGSQTLGSHPSGVLRWLDAQERLHHGEIDTELSNLNSSGGGNAHLKSATQPLSLRIDARESPGVEPSPGGTLLKTSHSGLSASAAMKEAEAFGSGGAGEAGGGGGGGGGASCSHAAAVYRSTILLTLQNENSEKGGGLGIQVKPYYSPSPGLSSRVEAGLEIQRVVPGGRMEREGKLRVGDRIIEINNQSLNSVSFIKAQEMFREAMRFREIALRVIPAEPVQSSASSAATKAPGPPVLPKPNVSSPPGGSQPTAFALAAAAAAAANSRVVPDNKRQAPMPPNATASDDEWDEAEQVASSGSMSGHLSSNNLQQQQQQASPLAEQKKAPPPPQRSPRTHLSRRNGSRERTLSKDEDEEPPRSSRSAEAKKRVASRSRGASGDRLRRSSLGGSKKDLCNTKRLGVKHLIVLVKGRDGFGFSLTTRDTQTAGPNPILVKSILNRGSAIRDGRLQCGDRMLEVDGVDVTHKSQKEVVQMLKSVAVNKSVRLGISRQEEDTGDGDDDDDGPDGRLGGGRVSDSTGELNTYNYRVTHMTFDISLEKTDLNGLGISVKGRSRESPGRHEEILADGKDEGVYVKNVISGGAAANDGRLQVNDQILEINGASLRGLSNKEALARLRSAVQRGSGTTSSAASSAGSGTSSSAGGAVQSSSAGGGGFIRVVIARRQPHAKTAASSSTTVNSGDSSNHSMTISAEVHQQSQRSGASTKGRLARQPTRQAAVEDDEPEDAVVPPPAPDDDDLDDDDLPLPPPPPPLDELDGHSGTLTSLGCSTLEHPDSNAISSLRSLASGPAPSNAPRMSGIDSAFAGSHLVPLLDLTAAAGTRRKLPTPPSTPRASAVSLTLPRKPDYPPPPPPPPQPVASAGSPSRSEPGHRRSASAELLGQHCSSSEEDSSTDGEGGVPTAGAAERRARNRRKRSAFAREGLGRRSMSEKRHAMEAAQNFSFFQELSAQRQRQREGSSSSQMEDPPVGASSEQLLQRCQRLLAQRHPSTDSLGRPSSRVVASPLPSSPPRAPPAFSTSSLRAPGPLKSVGPLLGREDSYSQLSTASTTMAHHPRARRCRPISFRRAVDHSLPEPDDVYAPEDGQRSGRTRDRPSAGGAASRKISAGFWRGLLGGGRRKGGLDAGDPADSVNSEPPPATKFTSAANVEAMASQRDSEARVLAWQQRNDAVLRGSRPRRLPSASTAVANEKGATAPGNRAFSVYIPADPADYEAVGGPAGLLLSHQRRRNSLSYEEEELEVPSSSPGRLQLAR